MELLDITKIWDEAPHNAFTDLIRFNGAWVCTFREGEDHWSEGAAGKIRVLTSRDAATWESASLIAGEGDLRDPKLSITPCGQLMLIYFRRFNPPRYPDEAEQQFAQFSANAREWTSPVTIDLPNRWLWRVTWHDGKAYGVSRSGPEGEPPFSMPRSGRLVVSADGVSFRPLADVPNAGEATIRFAADSTAWCLRVAKLPDGRRQTYWGRSLAPYDVWSWNDVAGMMGGPNFIILPDQRILAALRLYGDARGARTSLCWIDPDSGDLTEELTLPSGGDTSYAGLVLYDGLLWVSYYSSHEGKADIYLAKVRIGG